MIEAPASITCPDCRSRWHRYHDEAGRAIIHNPISYVKISHAGLPPGQPLLARSFTDLRNAVLPLDEGTVFTVELVAFMQTVGYGSYTRLGSGVIVLLEEAACRGLYLTLRQNIPVESQ